MNSVLENEAVQRVQKALSIFDNNIKISILEKTAKTAKDAAIALNCEIGAIVKSLLLKQRANLFYVLFQVIKSVH